MVTSSLYPIPPNLHPCKRCFWFEIRIDTVWCKYHQQVQRSRCEQYALPGLSPADTRMAEERAKGLTAEAPKPIPASTVEALTRDGGPAFPLGTVDLGNGATATHFGMSLRDWFAGQALIGAMNDGGEIGSWEGYAEAAYQIADEMMKAREK